MGLLDSIKDKASSAVKSVGSGISDAVTGTVELAKKIDEAPAAIAKGAKQAFDGAKELASDFKRDPGGTLKNVGKQALEGAKTVGKWSWEHKGEIGFWAGTTALLLATPISGGASGALAGAMMAGRGAAIAAKIGQAGRAGAAAVKTAKAGSQAVSTARGAFGGTKAGQTLTRAADKVHDGRVLLGSTKVGKGMNALGDKLPAGKVATVAFTAHFGDTAYKYSKGDASALDLGLATLGISGVGVGLYGKLFGKRVATTANEQAAKIVTKRIDKVADRAANATDDAARVAVVAPKVSAPQTAGAANAARDDAVETVNRALELRTKAHVTKRAGDADEAVSATRLYEKLDDVALSAQLGREHAVNAAALAPSRNLTRSAAEARDNLDEAAAIVRQTQDDIGHLARRQARGDKVAAKASAVEDSVGNATLIGYTGQGGVTTLHDRQELSMTDGSILKNLTSLLMGRTQSRAVAR